MVAHAFALRSGNAGPQFDGSSGDLLTLQSDGKARFVSPSSVGGDHMVGCTPDDIPGFLNNKMSTQDGAVLSLVENSPGSFVMQVGIAPPPFKAVYWVDPTSTRAPRGSATNPYISVAQAFAAAATAGITTGIIYLPPNAAITENVVFPLTGNWEIACPTPLANYASAGIVGNVDMTTSATARRALTNLSVTGNVSGNAVGAASRAIFSSVAISGTVALTATGGASWRAGFLSGGPPAAVAGVTSLQISSVAGTVSVAGVVYGLCTSFAGAITCVGACQFSYCAMPASFTTTGSSTVWLTGCTNFAGGAMTYTSASGTLLLEPDGATMTELMRSSLIFVGTASVRSQNSNQSARVTAAANVGLTALGARVPLSLMEMVATLTILTPGTTGSAVLNAIYTDLNGTIQTKPVTAALDISNAAGTEQKGALQFSQNGAAGVSYSVTGIVTPGPLSYSIGVALAQKS